MQLLIYISLAISTYNIIDLLIDANRKGIFLDGLTVRNLFEIAVVAIIFYVPVLNLFYFYKTSFVQTILDYKIIK